MKMYSKRNNFLFTDGNPMLRQGDTGDWIGTFLGHKGAVWGVALNNNATLAASGAADFTGKVWNALTGVELHSFQHKHIVKTVSFDSTSENLVTGSNEKMLRVFNLHNSQIDPEIYTGHSGPVKRAIFCRNDKCIISAAEDKTVRLWDRLTGKEVQRIDFPSNPNSLEISADQKVLTVTSGSAVSFWEIDTLKKIKEIKVPTICYSASLHPEKHCFVFGGEDFKMYKYDYITGNEIGKFLVLLGFCFYSNRVFLAESFKGHFGPVHSVRFSPDGELYASGSEDGTLRLWQTTVGKTYGLWKCTEPGELNNSISSPREVHAN